MLLPRQPHKCQKFHTAAPTTAQEGKGMRQRQATERRQARPPQLLAPRGSKGDPGQTTGPSLCSRPSAAPAALAQAGSHGGAGSYPRLGAPASHLLGASFLGMIVVFLGMRTVSLPSQVAAGRLFTRAQPPTMPLLAQIYQSQMD